MKEFDAYSQTHGYGFERGELGLEGFRFGVSAPWLQDVWSPDAFQGTTPDAPPPHSGAKNTGTSSWSTARLDQHWQSWSQDVADVALLMSIFASEPLPWILVELASDILGWQMAVVDHARCCLYDQGLVQLTDEGCYILAAEVYPLLQARLTSLPQAIRLRTAAGGAIAHLAEQSVCAPQSLPVVEAMPYLPSHISTAIGSLAQFMSPESYHWCCVALSPRSPQP